MQDAYAILIEGLTSAEEGELESRLIDRTFSDGEALLTEEEEAPGLYVLRQGLVVVSKRDMHGVDQTLANIQAPSVLGEIELVSRTPCNATVSADQAVEAQLLPLSDFHELVDRGEPFASKVLRNIANVLAQRLMRLNTEYVDMALWR